jgi:iron uptake system EfeUOB component EfeO/EfeM
LDHLASKAEQAYDDLMDLGMNVEVRYSGRIFEVASSMLKNAIDAKTAKVDKKLKAVDLQLKKYKIDKDSPEDPNDVLDGQGYVMLDRNELIKKLGGKE